MVGFPFTCLALAGQNGSPGLLARFCDCERREHAPRSQAGTRTCAVVCTRAACGPRSQEREKKPVAGGEK